MHSAAVRQLNTPAGRRPHASEIHEHRNRPAIAATAIQIPSLDASVGVICSTITSRVTCQSASPTPPVWLRPVRAPAKMLRGYLKSSVQRVCSTAAATAGSSIMPRLAIDAPPRSAPCASASAGIRDLRHPRIGLGHIGGTLLVAGVNQAD